MNARIDTKDLLVRDICSGFSKLIPISLYSKWRQMNFFHNGAEFALENFQYNVKKSSQESEASTKTLLEKLSASVAKEKYSNPVLLLSSGKDSVALALAYAECGISMDCLSIISDAEEREWLSILCRNLGHQVSFVSAEEVLNWLQSNSMDLNPATGVCFDQALLVFMAAASIAKIDSSITLIDGMGNDLYFGHIPSSNQLRSCILGKRLSSFANKGRIAKFYIRCASEAHGFTTAIPYFIDLDHEYFNLYETSDLSALCGNSLIDIIGFRAFVRGSLIDDFCYSEKTRILAKKFGANVRFPWAESDDLSQYVFNLPQSHKFNLNSMTNKILLRKLLAEKLSYIRPKRGVDTFESVDLAQLLKIDAIKKVPASLKAQVLSSRLLPRSSIKRAIIELGILNEYLKAVDEDISHYIRYEA